MFTNLNLTDMETCYKAFRREVIQSIEVEEDRFGFEPEITAKIAGGRLAHLGGRHPLRGPHLRRGQEDQMARRLARGVLGIVRYSGAWRRVRGRLDRAPDRSIPPAEFDDADSELADVLATRSRKPTNYADWIYSLVEPYLGETTCSRSAPATAS